MTDPVQQSAVDAQSSLSAIDAQSSLNAADAQSLQSAGHECAHSPRVGEL